MLRNWLGWLTVCVITLAPGCGHEQQLVSIAIAPTTETFGASNIPVSADAGLNVQLRALGTYIHPPVTKDITSQVVWTSNTPQMVTVSTGGLITATGQACGGALISATVTTNNHGTVPSSGALVTGSMTANVVCFTGTGPVLTVQFAGSGTGSVTSVPAGLDCSSTCFTSFPTNSNVTLTAAPNGTFGGWSGCDSTSGLECTVFNLTGARSVIVTFN
jgi:hypothetical protein